MPRFTPRVLLATAVMSLVATWHAGTAHAAPRHWRPEDYPNPSTDITRCSREAAGSLCDPDRLITTEAMADIDALLLKLKTGAKPFAQMDCGAAGLVGFPVGPATCTCTTAYVHMAATQCCAWAVLPLLIF